MSVALDTEDRLSVALDRSKRTVDKSLALDKTNKSLKRIELRSPRIQITRCRKEAEVGTETTIARGAEAEAGQGPQGENTKEKGRNRIKR